MKTFTAVVERDPVTGLLVGYVPGFPGAHSQAETLDELNANLREVIAILLEDGEPKIEAEFWHAKRRGCLIMGSLPVLKPSEVCRIWNVSVL